MKKQKAQSGFSLVEMMVAIAIFMVVAVIAVAALLKIVDANRKSQTLQDAINNINFAMDSITREVRVGKAYTCSSGLFLSSIPQGTSGGCPAVTLSSVTPGASSIAFLSSNLDPSNPTDYLTYAYYFGQHPDGFAGHWTIYKVQQNNYTDNMLPPGSNPSNGYVIYAPIIDPSIVITSYTIKVNVGNPNAQPSVFLYISGYTGSQASTQTHFDLQTTISERI